MGPAFSKRVSTPYHDFYEMRCLDIDRNNVEFSILKGKVILVVNVASKSSLAAHQYEELSALKGRFSNKGFTIMAFPSHQFNQEPGSISDIKAFAASKKYTGLLMGKVKVNGADPSPIYNFLKIRSADTKPISGDFEKFLINKNGLVHGRYPPAVTPLQLEEQIQNLLGSHSEASSPTGTGSGGVVRGRNSTAWGE